MKIQLTLLGGLYGILRLEPIELNKAALPADRYRAPDRSPARRAETRTEIEILHLAVLEGDAETDKYVFSREDLERDPRLKELFDYIWAAARPIPPK